MARRVRFVPGQAEGLQAFHQDGVFSELCKRSKPLFSILNLWPGTIEGGRLPKGSKPGISQLGPDILFGCLHGFQGLGDQFVQGPAQGLCPSLDGLPVAAGGKAF